MTQKKKALQYFLKEHLALSQNATPDQVIEYLENYKKLHFETQEKCKLISIKIEPSLLTAFKEKAKKLNIPYQTHIKKLMREWVTNG